MANKHSSQHTKTWNSPLMWFIHRKPMWSDTLVSTFNYVDGPMCIWYFNMLMGHFHHSPTIVKFVLYCNKNEKNQVKVLKKHYNIGWLVVSKSGVKGSFTFKNMMKMILKIPLSQCTEILNLNLFFKGLFYFIWN